MYQSQRVVKTEGAGAGETDREMSLGMSLMIRVLDLVLDLLIHDRKLPRDLDL